MSHRLDPHRFPALRAFVRGALHEDVFEEHASVEAAAAAWAAAADDAERRALAEELERLVRECRGGRFAAVRELFDGLGGAWSPSDENALRSLVSAVA